MGKITIAKSPKCDKWWKLGIRFDTPSKRGWLGLVANDNDHYQESKFDNENEHHHLHTNTLQTFMAWLHK